MSAKSSWIQISVWLAACALPAMLKADNGDWQTWDEVSWRQTLGNGLDAGLRFESRLEKDFSQFSYYEIEPSLTWRYSPRWDFGVGYERDERLKPVEEIVHVPNISATLKLPMKDWDLSNQSRVEFPVPEARDEDWGTVYRNRTEGTMKWRWGSKELVPYLFDEWFLNLKDGVFTENRVGVGMGIPVASHWDVKFYWMRQDVKEDEGWEWHPVLGFQIQAQF